MAIGLVDEVLPAGRLLERDVEAARRVTLAALVALRAGQGPRQTIGTGNYEAGAGPRRPRVLDDCSARRTGGTGVASLARERPGGQATFRGGRSDRAAWRAKGD